MAIFIEHLICLGLSALLSSLCLLTHLTLITIFWDFIVDETEMYSISKLPEISQRLSIWLGNSPWWYSDVTLCYTASAYSEITWRKSIFPIKWQRRMYYLIMIFLVKMTSWAVSNYMLYINKIEFKIRMWFILSNCHILYNWQLLPTFFFLLD